MLNIYKLKKNNINKNFVSEQGLIINDSKHKLPSTKEWFNSVYSFNKNNEKGLPNINITISKIIKSYFNMFSIKLERRVLKRVMKWKRRLKLNRILIGKPEFKHTNDKVIITLYVYNRELLLLKKKMIKLKRKIYLEYFLKLVFKNLLIFKKINIIKNILIKITTLKREFRYIMKKLKFRLKKGILKKKNLRLFGLKRVLFLLAKTIKRYKDIKGKTKKYKIRSAKTFKYLENKIKYYRPNDYKNLSIPTKSSIMNHYIYNIQKNNNNINNNIKKFFNIIPKFELSRLVYLKFLKKLTIKLRLYLRYNRIIFFNRSKFNIHIIPLKKYIEKIYKKEVEFNIVNLKSYHLDSNILTQIMAIKLRNRKNRVNRIIKKLLKKIKTPLGKRLEYNEVIQESEYLQNLLIKQLINNKTYNMIPSIKLDSLNKKSGVEVKQIKILKSNNDKLDMILKILQPTEYNLCKDKVDVNLSIIRKRNSTNTTLDTIKYKIVSGIKIEASGRLSKRIIASKSIHKIKQIGTIKDINSSYKKLSSMLLRGNNRSNIQLSKLSGKTRIGAFGLKGWVASI